jgi:glycosyltransferase involved in cell wall biosynthesis
MEKKYLFEFPFLKGRTETIFNGFDEEDLSVGLEKEFEKRTLLHLGNLHLDLNPTYPILLLKGLQKLKAENVVTESNFQVVVVGEQFEDFNEKVRELGLSGIVSNLERVSHSEAIPYLKRAHVLLLVVETEGIMTSKIFEYLAAGKPVFALIKPGELMELIQEFSPASTIVTSYDPDEIAEGIGRCLGWKGGFPQRRDLTERFRTKFNRKELTRQLVKVVDELAGEITSD